MNSASLALVECLLYHSHWEEEIIRILQQLSDTIFYVKVF